MRDNLELIFKTMLVGLIPLSIMHAIASVTSWGFAIFFMLAFVSAVWGAIWAINTISGGR
jgi:hypothetical protein